MLINIKNKNGGVHYNPPIKPEKKHQGFALEKRRISRRMCRINRRKIRRR